MSDVLNLIKKVGESEKSRQSVVVFLKENQREVKLYIHGGLSKVFYIKPRNEGFYNIILQENRIRGIKSIDDDAPEIYDFLEEKRKINMVLCRSVGDSDWLAIPENYESSSRVGIIGSQIISRCDNCNYFDHVVCSITEDNNLVFFDIDYTYTNEIVEEMRTRFLEAKENLDKNIEMQLSTLHQAALDLAKAEIDELIEAREAERRKVAAERREEMRRTIRGRIQLALEETGARLIRHTNRRNLVDVSWESQGGDTYHSVLEIDTLNVVSAGLCLAGGDAAFDLTSLVGVVHEGERTHRINIY